MNIEELERQSKEDLKLSIDSLEYDSIRTPQINHKYIKELLIAKDLYSRYEFDLKRLKKRKWLYYSGKANPEVYVEKPLDLKIMKSDLKMFIESDKDVIEKFLNSCKKTNS